MPNGQTMDSNVVYRRLLVRDMLVIRRNCATLLLVICNGVEPDDADKFTTLKVFDVDSWDCLSMSRIAGPNPEHLYQVLDDIFMYNGGFLYRVTSVNPIAVTYHGRTELSYDFIAVLDQHTLIGLTHGEAYLFSPSGKHLRKLHMKFRLRHPIIEMMSVGNRTVVVHTRDLSDDGWYREPQSRMMSATVSDDGDLSLNWRSHVLEVKVAETIGVLIMAGVIIIHCNCYSNVMILDLHSGKRIQDIGVSPNEVSPLGSSWAKPGIPVYRQHVFAVYRQDFRDRLCIEFAAEFQLQGMYI
jgi:hypothetical protein